MKAYLAALCAGAAIAAMPAAAQSIVTERSVAAHEAFLASDALQGRGSATRDEAIAAAYVASQFQSYGLMPAPGMTGFLQKAMIIRETLSAPATLTVGGVAVASPTLLLSSGKPISGALAVATEADPGKLPNADVVLVSARNADPMTSYRAVAGRPIKLIIVRENEGSRKLLGMLGGKPRLPTYLEDMPPRERPSCTTCAGMPP